MPRFERAVTAIANLARPTVLYLSAISSAIVIWMFSIRSRRHSGSKIALPKRSASRFWTVSLPR